MKKLTEAKMKQILEFAYEKAVSGVLGTDSAITLAHKHKKVDDCIHKQCDKLIKRQKAKAAVTGFFTGMGGLFWIPLTLPINLTILIYLQIRMIAAIAHLAGYDLKDEKVKTMIFICLVGNGAAELFREIGVELEKKIASNVTKNVSTKVMKQVQRKIIFKLLGKFGEKSVARLIPFISGIIGGVNDFFVTHEIGKISRDVFLHGKHKLN